MDWLSFHIPDECWVNARIAKKTLLEEAELTAADKRLIKNGIEEITWLYAFRPANCGINVYADEQFCYDEIHWLHVRLKAGFMDELTVAKVNELLQKSIPYAAFIWITDDNDVALGGAIKRIHAVQREKRVTEEILTTQLFKKDVDALLRALKQLQFPTLHRASTDLKQCYENILSIIIQLRAVEHFGTGVIVSSADIGRSLELLKKMDALDATIASLKNKLSEETQINRKVELNMQIKEIERKSEHLKTSLSNNTTSL